MSAPAADVVISCLEAGTRWVVPRRFLKESPLRHFLPKDVDPDTVAAFQLLCTKSVAEDLITRTVTPEAELAEYDELPAPVTAEGFAKVLRHEAGVHLLASAEANEKRRAICRQVHAAVSKAAVEKELFPRYGFRPAEWIQLLAKGDAKHSAKVARELPLEVLDELLALANTALRAALKAQK